MRRAWLAGDSWAPTGAAMSRPAIKPPAPRALTKRIGSRITRCLHSLRPFTAVSRRRQLHRRPAQLWDNRRPLKRSLRDRPAMAIDTIQLRPTDDSSQETGAAKERQGGPQVQR